jgi:hypothetical protein
MSNYLQNSDITDAIAQGYINKLSSQPWHLQVNEEIEALAAMHSIPTTAIVKPLHPMLKKYARSFFCYVLFRDLLGENLGSNESIASIDNDKYKVKFDIYDKYCNEIRQEIKADMFVNAVQITTPINYVRSTVIYPS